MSWLDKLLPPKIQQTDPSTRKGIPEGLWVKCPSCESTLYRTDVEANLHVCPKCDHHMRIRSRERLDKLLDADLKYHPRKDQIRAALKEYKRQIELRLHRVRGEMAMLKIKTFLDDQTQYDFIVNQIKTGHWWAVRGDLTAKETVKAIGAAAKQLNVPVRITYLSNAERYWPYNQDFRENMLSLPMDDKSVVIRTVGAGKKTAADPYHYVVQDGLGFQEWMKTPTPKVAAILVHRVETKTPLLYKIDAKPTDKEKADFVKQEQEPKPEPKKPADKGPKPGPGAKPGPAPVPKAGEKPAPKPPPAPAPKSP